MLSWKMLISSRFELGRSQSEVCLTGGIAIAKSVNLEEEGDYNMFTV